MKNNPHFVFFGTPEMAVFVLDELEQAHFLPSLVITAPDQPQGRGLTLTAPPAKMWAEERDIPVFQPERFDEATLQSLEGMGPWDLFIVAAYGKIIPQSVIDIPQKGVLNVHPSLLPRFRGASPVKSQILEDEKNVGTTVMKIDAKMDHGPILAQKNVEIEKWPPTGSNLQERLFREGGKLLADVIPGWLSGEIEAEEQNHDKATFTHKISKADGEINLTDDAYANFLKIQAFDVWPRTYFFYNTGDKKIRVIISHASFENGTLKIKRVIPEGKGDMSYEDFLRGFES